MTSPAGILDDPVIEFRDLNGVRVLSAREVEGVPKSVVRFYCIFSDDVMRCVADVAGRHRMVARLHPAVVLRPHDVAVRTSGGVVREIRVSLGIDEGVGAKADGHSDNGSGRKRDCNRATHWPPGSRTEDTSASAPTQSCLEEILSSSCDENLLAVDVRALPRIAPRSGWLFDDLHIKTDRQGLWRKALRVIASLVAKHAVHGVFSGHDRGQRMHDQIDVEIPAVDVELRLG